MTTFRWMTLRVFWSLLALIPMAFFVLWLVHEYLLPQSNVLDEAIVAALGFCLFGLAGHFLTREGGRRFDFLHGRGRELLEGNREAEVQEVFFLLQQLLRSGLLSEKKQRGLRRQLLRSYFPFYAEHPERPDFQEQLALALREAVRPEEAYHVLKSHVLRQKTLTLETANLAEELLDHRPEDETLTSFFVEQFLQQKKTHYRAEYFYAKYLAKGGPLTDEILALCLPKVLQHPRRDDFAGWCLVRAFDHAGQRERVRRALYALHQIFQQARRRDALAHHIAGCAGQISSEEKTGWQVVPEKVEKKTAQQWARYWRFQARQWWWDGLSLLRPHQRSLALGFMVVFLLGMIYLTRSFSLSPQSQLTATPSATAPDTTQYFSLQVVALKDKRSTDAAVTLLQRRRLEVYVLEPRSSRGWYRVRVGKYPSTRRARLAADSLKAAGLIEDYFVTNFEGR